MFTKNAATFTDDKALTLLSFNHLCTAAFRLTIVKAYNSNRDWQWQQ